MILQNYITEKAKEIGNLCYEYDLEPMILSTLTEYHDLLIKEIEGKMPEKDHRQTGDVGYEFMKGNDEGIYASGFNTCLDRVKKILKNL